MKRLIRFCKHDQDNSTPEKIKKEMMMTIIVNGGAGDDIMNYMPGDFNGQAFEINGGSGDDVITIGNSASNFTASPEDPIAANEHGRIWGDPHFEGGDGGRYDVQGEAGKTYSLLTDHGLDLRGRFDAWSAGATVVGKTGLTLTGEDDQTSEIAFNKDGTATIDGQAMEEGKTYDLADGGTAILEEGVLTVKTAEGYTIEQSTRGSGDRAFINIDVTTGENGVGNGQLPGGLLGQSFDADSEARVGTGNQGEGAIEGSVEDYEVDVIFQSTIDDPIAANEHGRIWGDPHFEGGDGGKYDVQGEAGKTYSLLTDEGLDLRGRFDAWSEGVTIVGQTGLTLTGTDGRTSEIAFSKDGTATINGEVMEEGKTYDLADGGTAILEEGVLTVNTAEGYTIEQSTHGSGDRAYINVDVTTGENGVGSGRLPGGLLGQSFDADSEARVGSGNQGEGAIDGSVEDYEVDVLFMSNGHVNGGSGDDLLNLFTYGNYVIDMGSGDDELNVDFEEDVKDAKAIVNGGSGDDTVVLAGSEEDYLKTEEEGYTVYTDANGNSISVGEDVEEVLFKSED
jgi:hypothetical protein